jgi:hypothetical protein
VGSTAASGLLVVAWFVRRVARTRSTTGKRQLKRTM